MDGDGVYDLEDTCPLSANPDQKDLDLDGIGDTCDPEVIIPELVAYYSFDEDASDSTTRYDGTFLGGAAIDSSSGYTFAKLDSASDAQVELPKMIEKNFSISFYMQTEMTSQEETVLKWFRGYGLIDAEVGGAAEDFGSSLLNEKVAFGIGNVDYTIMSETSVNDGNWHHVVLTRNSTSGEMKIYVNGSLETTGTGPVGERTSPTRIVVGSIQTDVRFFEGNMDELRFYNYVLDADDVSDLYVSRGNPNIQAVNPLQHILVSPNPFENSITI
ncbi:MAG: LamG domain-containing protein, partial [Desulfobacterales bacterium]|nr:LamG domain-containing protein [Desulfobacterales bacterium]